MSRFNSAADASVAATLRSEQEAVLQTIRTYFAQRPAEDGTRGVVVTIGQPPTLVTSQAQSRYTPTQVAVLFIVRDTSGVYHLDYVNPLRKRPWLSVYAPDPKDGTSREMDLYIRSGVVAQSLDAAMDKFQRAMLTRQHLVLSVHSARFVLPVTPLYSGFVEARTRHRQAVTAAAGEVIARRLAPGVLNRLYRPGGQGAERVRRRAIQTRGIRGRRRKQMNPRTTSSA